jgi:hypothetical protein
MRDKVVNMTEWHREVLVVKLAGVTARVQMYVVYKEIQTSPMVFGDNFYF